ncbi:MAG: DNA-processing protein DprA [Treponema sp.]|jgi:DNA processing protein|nr:DNA-processing protein DprA [Treponema sp.]
MNDRGLLDLIIGRIPGLVPADRVLLSRRFDREGEVTALAKKDVEGLLGHGIKRPWDMDAITAQAEKDAAAARLQGIGYVSYTATEYPPLLREIWDPPALLFYRGRLPNAAVPLAALVGTRRPSGPATAQAYTLAKGLAQGGIPVVSGLALGIDAMAHRGNIEGGAPTVAVLGSGLDEIYPATNRMLARRIVEQGGVLLSEYPPGIQPRKWHFPARNRIIAGLSRGVLIVEAPQASGALITAQFALEQGRDLWVASAGVASPLGEGTRKLAEEGAGVITTAVEILAEWGITPRGAAAEGLGEQQCSGDRESDGDLQGYALALSLARSLNIVYEE